MQLVSTCLGMMLMSCEVLFLFECLFKFTRTKRKYYKRKQVNCVFLLKASHVLDVTIESVTFMCTTKGLLLFTLHTKEKNLEI